MLRALDALGAPPPAPRAARAARGADAPPARGWTRSPVALGAGAVLLLVFGVVIGVSVGRYTEPGPAEAPRRRDAAAPPAHARAAPSPGRREPCRRAAGAAPAGEPGAPDPARDAGAACSRPRARASTPDATPEAIAAYQAVLKRDPKNVDAMTHLGFIVALGGHADSALETIDSALAIDPNYPPARYYRGQVLYEAKRDTAGAIEAWERFVGPGAVGPRARAGAGPHPGRPRGPGLAPR